MPAQVLGRYWLLHPLEVVFGNGVSPDPGKTFTFLTAGSIVNEFETVVCEGTTVRVVYEAGAVRLEVQPL